ncbi:Histidinol dehydrogenase [Commensalibacter sp. Nvir]|uniref:histidinol dehydrogenase n=1 Tax=Commensalibacter sp. Nvir TaxID=3069817 RepID=UPI002D31ACB2|nr:Histidinol dehydrogenase [Commensalibacter sp. Nvir]
MHYLNSLYPNFNDDFEKLLKSRTLDTHSVKKPVSDILQKVQTQGDKALCEFTEQFDRLSLTPKQLRINQYEIEQAYKDTSLELIAALDLAIERIKNFHQKQLPSDLTYQDESGFHLGYRWTPIDSAGLYVPGGTAAYPSSVLMNSIPAKVAGVKRLAMCVPSPDKTLNPLVLVAADKIGINEIYRVGGAQAIAALAFGTETIKAVDYIVGPGNAFVAEAKRQVYGVVGIDSVAGPSEIVIVTDNKNNPDHVALDLLAQAEHDRMAQSILLTDDQEFADRVDHSIQRQLQTLTRHNIAQASWKEYGTIIIVHSWDKAIDLINRIAPEHLELMLDNPEPIFNKVRHAGAIFIGKWCPEAIGDYIGGPNHVLPTGGTARFSSGLSVFNFMKRSTYLKSDQKGIREVGPAAVSIALTEGLTAHALSISQRLESLNNKD